MRLPESLEHLIGQLQKLPGIGPKNAQRLALFLLRMPEGEAEGIAESILNAKKRIFACSQCGNLTDSEPCLICADTTRQQNVLCITEDASDVMAIERTGSRGQYVVLEKSLNLMDVQDWANMDLSRLKKRLQSGQVEEVILALNPDLDGDVVSRIIAAQAAQYGVKTTRLAHGLPVGGDIQFADEITLRQALEGRKEL